MNNSEQNTVQNLSKQHLYTAKSITETDSCLKEISAGSIESTQWFTIANCFTVIVMLLL